MAIPQPRSLVFRNRRVISRVQNRDDVAGHSLRRGHITQAAQNGASLERLMTQAGHVDLRTTTRLPEKYRQRLRTTNMLERFIQEIPHSGDQASGKGDSHLPEDRFG